MWGWYFFIVDSCHANLLCTFWRHDKTSNLNIFWRCLSLFITKHFALSGTLTLLVVSARLWNLILCNRLFPHVVATTTFFADSSSVLLSKSIAVVAAIERLAWLPFLQIETMNFLTFSSMIGLTIRGLLHIKFFNSLSGDRPETFETFTFSSYFLTNVCTINSFIVGYLFLKKFAACDTPLSLECFAIVYLS